MLDDPKLPQKAKELILDEENEIYYSAASIWEIMIKHISHPDTFLYSGKTLAEGCDNNGFNALPVLSEHTYALESLKRGEDAPPHNDPFDRILLAQAKTEGMMFLTHDSLIPFYNEPFAVVV